MEYTVQNVKQALKELVNITGWELGISQATNDEISAYEKEHGLSFPPEFKEWLMLCNGIMIPSIMEFSGINQESDKNDIYKDHLCEYIGDDWRKNNWITLTHDFCGNYYILDGKNCINGKHPVYFIDHEGDIGYGIEESKPTYIAASGLFEFLTLYFEQTAWEQEVELSGSDPEEICSCHGELWPFGEKYVLERDPDVLKVKLKTGIDLPWES